MNLIGEHIDYSLFGVLPAAVEPDILIACGTHGEESRTVVVDNVHPKYDRKIFEPATTSVSKPTISGDAAHTEEWHLDINKKELRWESYVKAGYYGVLERFFPAATTLSSGANQGPVPVDLLVTGAVPAGSGLSSSAAMVVASTLAFLAVNGKLDPPNVDKIITKGELVQMSMENEKRVGVNSGGMDQAASVMSDPASALYISFYPELKASPVPLPHGVVFVCANSLVVSDKAVSAKRCYNLRVVETLVAARVLARSLNVPLGAEERVTLREVVGRWAGEDIQGGKVLSADALAEALQSIAKKLDVLHSRDGAAVAAGRSGVTLEEMIEMSGLQRDAFQKVYLSWIEVEATEFELYKRTKHVLLEALRVLQFRQLCLEASTAAESAGTGDMGVYQKKLGKLMNESQESCAELFECSCPELDQLTKLARSAGAFGSRLTGAGWGGCTVSIVAEDQVDGFIAKIKEEYPPYKGLEDGALKEAIFATRPGRGACVLKL